MLLHSGSLLGRQELMSLPSPPSTDTHTVIPHAKVVEATLEALEYRRIRVVSEEYAIARDGAQFFGLLVLDIGEDSERIDRTNLVLGLRNSHDKSFSLGMVAGFRVFVCSNLAFRGDFFAIAKRHSKKILDNFQDTVAIGVDRVQRHFKPMQEQINVWRNHQLPDVQAKAVIYDAFIGGKLDAPKHLAPIVHEAYFNPQVEAFEPRTLWSLQNGFTNAFKQLEPVPQVRATASLGAYFEGL